MTLFAVTLKVVRGIVYLFFYQPICFDNTMLEEEWVIYKLGIMQDHRKEYNSPMYVTQLTTDSEMRSKAWQTIHQWVAGTLYKSNCNFITPSISYVILEVTKVMHQQFLICDTLCSGDINSHLRCSQLSGTRGASIVCLNSSTKSPRNTQALLPGYLSKKSRQVVMVGVHFESLFVPSL